MSKLQKFTKPVLLTVLGVLLLALIFSVSNDLFLINKGQSLKGKAPKPHYYASNFDTRYSKNFQNEESAKIKQKQRYNDPQQYLGWTIDAPYQSPSKPKMNSQPNVDGGEQDINVDAHNDAKTLPPEVIGGVETFVYFIGYARSGSSIMSSLMDAHPHVVVSYQYGVFKDWSKKLRDKNFLFNELYRKSKEDAEVGKRSESFTEVKKNYTLHAESPWQGKYDRYISVIGDKHAGQTVSVHVTSPSTFIHRYRILEKTVGVPIKAVFVLRNPFDIISTTTLYANSKKLSNRTLPNDKSQGLQPTHVTVYKSFMKSLYESGNIEEFQKNRFKTDTLSDVISMTADKTKAIADIIQFMGRENVWQVHNMDLVNNPKKVLLEMCEFFEIDCSPDYIEACAGTVFKSVSKTRDLLVWPQKEKQMVMDSIVDQFSFFNRYSFESD